MREARDAAGTIDDGADDDQASQRGQTGLTLVAKGEPSRAVQRLTSPWIVAISDALVDKMHAALERRLV